MRLTIVSWALVQRLQRRVQHAVDTVLGEHLAVLGLDVDVRRRAGRWRPAPASPRAARPGCRRAATPGRRPRSRRRPAAARAALRSPARAGSRHRGGGAGPPRRARAVCDDRLDGTRQQELELVQLQRVFQAAEASTRRAPSWPSGTQPNRTSVSSGTANQMSGIVGQPIERVEEGAEPRPGGGPARDRPRTLRSGPGCVGRTGAPGMCDLSSFVLLFPVPVAATGRSDSAPKGTFVTSGASALVARSQRRDVGGV